jgi:hypothetical protein
MILVNDALQRLFSITFDKKRNNKRYLLQRFLEVLEKLFTGRKVAGTGKAHIVLAQRVGDDQMRFIAVLEGPVGEIIGVTVTIVLEAAFFNDQTARVHVRFALVHTHGPFAEQPVVNLHRPPNVIPLRLFVDIGVVNPTIPVGGDFPVLGLLQGLTDSGIAFEGLPYGKERVYQNE